MAQKKVILKDGTDELLPKTSASMVFTESGQTVEAALQNANVSKETIEQALTGNITTHRHDTTYNYTDFETDVWDGTSISTSLQGSGTKDDPYLIQSCADWLHLRNQSSTYNNENGTYFKLNKSLDFNNKPIPESSSSGNVVLIIDGNNATISNFSCDDTGGLLKGVYPCFFFNFNLKGIEITTDVSVGGSGIFGGARDLYNCMYNVSVKAKYIINGDLSEKAQFQVFLLSGQMAVMVPQIVAELSEYFEAPNNIATEIEVEDNTIKSNGAKLEVLIMNQIYPGEFRGYDSSYSNITDINTDDGTITYEGDTGIAYVINTASDFSKFYWNSDKSSRIFIIDYDGNLVDSQNMPTKTTSEMQSDAFVELLNEGMETPVFLKDKDGGTPVLAPKNATIGYDGYVRKSEFEEFKSNLPTYEPVEPTTKSVVYTDINFFQANQGGNFRNLTEENFIENLGGVDAVKEMIRMIADTETVITSTVIMYIVPVLVTSTAKVYINQTKSDQSEPEDGDSFVFSMEAVLDNGSELNSLYVSCSVTNFNKENMTVEITRRDSRMVESEEIRIIKKLTQSEYDGLSSKNSNTLW